MSADKIQLPDFLIADLYKNSLVDIADVSASNAATASEPATERAGAVKRIQYLGENRKHVVIMVNEPDAAFIEENNLTFLTNILKACNLTLADIAIINLAKQEADFSKLKEQLHLTNLLLFGVEMKMIKLPFISPLFQVQQYDNVSVLASPPLSEMNLPAAEATDMKRKLWTSLKKMMDI